MNRLWHAITMLTATVCLLCAARSPADETEPERLAQPVPVSTAQAPPQDVIARLNIFVRQRGRPAEPVPTDTAPVEITAAAPAPATQPSPRTSTALVGVLLSEEGPVAFFEHIRDGGQTRAMPGDAVADGRVVDVTLDGVIFESDDGMASIAVGCDLNGQPATLGATGGGSLFGPSPATAPAATVDRGAPPSPAPAQADPRLMSLEERMRQRRMQEMNR